MSGRWEEAHHRRGFNNPTPKHRHPGSRLPGSESLTAMPRTWGRLLAIGAKESEPYRRIELDLPEVAIGRGEGSYERIATILSPRRTAASQRTQRTPHWLRWTTTTTSFPSYHVWWPRCGLRTAPPMARSSTRKGSARARVRLTQNDEIGSSAHAVARAAALRLHLPRLSVGARAPRARCATAAATDRARHAARPSR